MGKRLFLVASGFEVKVVDLLLSELAREMGDACFFEARPIQCGQRGRDHVTLCSSFSRQLSRAESGFGAWFSW